jgi:putative hydrolase of the HAD superfamily
MIVNWEKIDTVLLDMDGTLLDLNFDNHFWNEFVPLKFAEKNGISLTLAKQQLKPQFKRMEGRLEWYCLDYWSQELQLDITGLKAEISRLISVLPHVTEFLEKLQQTSKKVLLVTNAHPYSLELKMEKTCLQLYFDEIISSHDLGAPKERREFWELLLQKHVFDINTTLLIDDSVSVLKAAQLYGIKYLISISKPDSKMPIKDVIGYPAIEDFKTLIFGL